MARHYLSTSLEAARVLGHQISIARRRQRRTAKEVAERAGVTRVTLGRIERGDPEVGMGLYFEVTSVLGVPIFGAEGSELAGLVARGERELALLPARVFEPRRNFDDDF
jgi:transcriptional regulator with XRE-family HTH domain